MFAVRTTSHSLRNAFTAIIAVGLAPWFTLSHVEAQEDLQPYTVYVDQEQVMARCGPGGDYYRTDELRHGQALEVYVETADHWLGVRPPDGSFSWLPADAVTLSPSKGFATVNEDHTIAWIGTHLGQASKYLWQVELEQGEEVAIIGRAKREGPEGMKVWYRIVPPAGEFRWVHRDQVVDSPELLLRDKQPAPRVAGQSKLNVRPAAFAANEEAETESNEEAGPANESVQSRNNVNETPNLRPLPVPEPDAIPLKPSKVDSLHEHQASMNEPVSAQEIPIGSGVVQAIPLQSRNPIQEERIARSESALQVGFTSSPRIVNIGEPVPPAPTPVSEMTDSFSSRNAPRGQAAPAYQDARVIPQVVPTNLGANGLASNSPLLSTFSSVQTELSRLMAASSSANEVQMVVDAAERLMNASATEAERQQYLTLIERAKKYQQVALRRNAQVSAGATIPASYPAPVPNEMVSVEEPVQDSVSGYLVQVFSARPDSPPFALTDSQGRTTCYLSASPGVNLRRYLNQHVTVRGATGYSTGLDTPHVIATSAMKSQEVAR